MNEKQLFTIIVLCAVFGAFLILVHMLDSHTLSGIKSKIVGDGQHGTARWAAKQEIKKTFVFLPFEPELWRQGKNLPDIQGTIVGCRSHGKKTVALVDTGDVHTLMIGAAGVGKTAFFLYPNIEFALASGMSFLNTDTKGDVARNYGNIAKKYYGYNVSVIDLRNPTRSDENNILHLVNKYMDQWLADKSDLSSKAKAEKYAKITAKTIINIGGGDNTNYGQNSFLSNAKGKKVYGYLKSDVKKTVDAIFARLTQNADIQQMYKLWCDMEQAKHDVYSSAKVQFPDLVDNLQFKSVKNMIVKTVTAMQIVPPPDFLPPEIETPLDDFDFESEFTAEGVAYKIEWSDAYKSACKLFYKKYKTDVEKQECLCLFQAEADAGNVLALHDLGKLYGSSFFGEPDSNLSAEYYRQALTRFLALEDHTEQMKPYLQYRIGKMFAYGLGTAQDDVAAFEWFQKSALAGNKFAQYSLASCFYYGKGTTQDLSEAFHWYKAAAEQGQPYSAYALAQMYEKGEAVPPDVDISRAADLFRRAVGYRNKWAEYQLGKLYLFGVDGITPDREQAIEWLTRSAEDGNEYAEQLLQNTEDYQNRMLTDTVFGLFVNVGRMIEEDHDRTERVIQSKVDSKLRRAIRRKKMELGIKEEQPPIQKI